MKAAALITLFCSMAAAGECVGINGNWIRAADLRSAVPELEALPPETPLWHAPALGTTRQVNRTDWEAVARQFSIPIAPRTICVAQRVRAVGPAEWEESLARAIAGLGATEKAAITSVSHTQLPEGSIELPAAGLTRMGGSSYLWRGRLRHETGYEVPVWIRFVCPVWREALIATRNLHTGDPIVPADFTVEIRPGQLRGPVPVSASDAVGRTMRRPLRAGSEILETDLVTPVLVQPGQPARVSVRGEGTMLEFPAIATQAGRLGERILLENPANRRRFKAVVTGPQSVSVVTGPGGTS